MGIPRFDPHLPTYASARVHLRLRAIYSLDSLPYHKYSSIGNDRYTITCYARSILHNDHHDDPGHYRRVGLSWEGFRALIAGM